LGDTASDQSKHVAPAVRSQRDQIRSPLKGGGDDLGCDRLIGCCLADLAVHPHAGRCQFFRCGSDPFLHGPTPLRRVSGSTYAHDKYLTAALSRSAPAFGTALSARPSGSVASRILRYIDEETTLQKA